VAGLSNGKREMEATKLSEILWEFECFFLFSLIVAILKVLTPYFQPHLAIG
jgi:hypothetical protein